MRGLFLCCSFLVCLCGTALSASEPLTQLKAKRPNWRFEIVETFTGGIPKEILFFEPVLGSTEGEYKNSR
jgi:hypothetical protein